MIRQGVKTALPNTQEQTQGGCQIEVTKKYGPNARRKQNSRKELNEMEISNLSDEEFKTLVRMLKELAGYCTNIKKTQAEIKLH